MEFHFDVEIDAITEIEKLFEELESLIIERSVGIDGTSVENSVDTSVDNFIDNTVDVPVNKLTYINIYFEYIIYPFPLMMKTLSILL